MGGALERRGLDGAWPWWGGALGRDPGGRGLKGRGPDGEGLWGGARGPAAGG